MIEYQAGSRRRGAWVTWWIGVWSCSGVGWFCLDRGLIGQALCRQKLHFGNMIVPSGYHPVGSGALTTLIISATQAVTAGHGARCGGDSDQHGKPWAE